MKAVFAVLILSLVFLASCKTQGEEGVVIEIGDKTFVAEIADTDQERATGLMNRDSMPNNHGMLFIFEDQQNRSFWMKNTKIPLDMIFIGSDWRIVSINKNAQPCTADPCDKYESRKPAMYVLEVNAGQVDEKAIKVGQRLYTSLD